MGLALFADFKGFGVGSAWLCLLRHVVLFGLRTPQFAFLLRHCRVLWEFDHQNNDRAFFSFVCFFITKECFYNSIQEIFFFIEIVIS